MRIEHMAMYVNDLEAERDFFVKYFNVDAGEKYHNFRTGFSSYFLTFDEGSRLEIMNRPVMTDSPKGDYRTGYHHIAICVGGGQSVEATVKRMQEDGHQVLSGARWTGDGYYEAVVSDPEGNSIEIVAEPDARK